MTTLRQRSPEGRLIPLSEITRAVPTHTIANMLQTFSDRQHLCEVFFLMPLSLTCPFCTQRKVAVVFEHIVEPFLYRRGMLFFCFRINISHRYWGLTVDNMSIAATERLCTTQRKLFSGSFWVIVSSPCQNKLSPFQTRPSSPILLSSQKSNPCQENREQFSVLVCLCVFVYICVSGI